MPARPVRRAFLKAGLALAALLSASAPGHPARAAEKLVFMLDWQAEAEHGGYFQAVAEGLYQKAGLDVTIVPGGPGMSAQQMLAAGKIDGTIGSNAFYVLNLVEAGAKVKAVASMFQKDPTILMAHAQNTTSLADLKGRPIFLGDPSINTLWRWLKSKYPYEDSQIRRYTGNLAPFLTTSAAAAQGYATSEPLIAKKAGADVKVFLLADQGYDGYSGLVMFNDAYIQAHPAAVKAFVAATAEGWRHYLHGDAAPADALIRKSNPDMDAETLAYGRKALADDGIVEGTPAASDSIGRMTAARWDSFTNEMKRLGIYKAGTDWKAGVDLGTP
ncbi:NitT/TauT family transport system substrate-binding protein [Nitrospirillum amazonense]|uniref:NitT/TauT family transport system substrate-binding protein n=1 Tax=Nitrospirillum amazonense TaxID=28077 RepID=A0A560FA56_9PROT|nr:ABC transporter substrate-binding protein [Nitrospirillum amazonense]TWB18474.1 NitT/TauT family transport system substrate-binding protein [Nitrospirillum amazonense]